MTWYVCHHTDSMEEEDQIILVVQGRQIAVRRSALAVVSKFFRALFSHQFQDSKKRVLHLDPGGQMGLTNSAVQVRNDQFSWVPELFTTKNKKGPQKIMA